MAIYMNFQKLAQYLRVTCSQLPMLPENFTMLIRGYCAATKLCATLNMYFEIVSEFLRYAAIICIILYSILTEEKIF